MFSMGSSGRWKRKANPRNFGEKCFIWEAKTSLKGGIKESAKVFPRMIGWKSYCGTVKYVWRRKHLRRWMRWSKVHVSACQHSVQRKPWIPHLEVFAETHKRQRHVRCVFAATLVNKKKRSLSLSCFWAWGRKHSFFYSFAFWFISRDWNESDKQHFYGVSWCLPHRQKIAAFLKKKTKKKVVWYSSSRLLIAGTY